MQTWCRSKLRSLLRGPRWFAIPECLSMPLSNHKTRFIDFIKEFFARSNSHWLVKKSLIHHLYLNKLSEVFMAIYDCFFFRKKYRCSWCTYFFESLRAIKGDIYTIHLYLLKQRFWIGNISTRKNTFYSTYVLRWTYIC